MVKRLMRLHTFLKSLRESLFGKREKRYRNSELDPSLLACGKESKKKSGKFLVQKYAQKFRQKRRIRKENFVSPAQVKTLRKKIVRGSVFCALLLLFFGCKGHVRVGSLLSDISLFKVGTLSVEGCRSTPEKRVRELSGIILHKTSLLELDPGVIARRIEQEPWVREVHIDRDWPSDIVITVREHEPLALMNLNTGGQPELYYMDSNGKPFLQVNPGQDIDYPVITGLDMVTDTVLRKRLFEDIRDFLKRARRNNPNLPVQAVSEMHINRYGNMVVYLVDYPFPIFFGQGDTTTKFDRLRKVLESMYREKKSDSLLSGVKYIKMDYLQDKVLVARAQGESG